MIFTPKNYTPRIFSYACGYPVGVVLVCAGYCAVFSSIDRSIPPLAEVSLDSCFLGLLLAAGACFRLCFEVEHQWNLLWTSVKLQVGFSAGGFQGGAGRGVCLSACRCRWKRNSKVF